MLNFGEAARFRLRYETSFWLLKAIHDSECKKLMEDHHLVPHGSNISVSFSFFAHFLLRGLTNPQKEKTVEISEAYVPRDFNKGLLS